MNISLLLNFTVVCNNRCKLAYPSRNYFAHTTPFQEVALRQRSMTIGCSIGNTLEAGFMLRTWHLKSQIYLRLLQ
jgi:hypothetical protein